MGTEGREGDGWHDLFIMTREMSRSQGERKTYNRGEEEESGGGREEEEG
jgi:hypothetical protein